jgi:hypothetical protein
MSGHQLNQDALLPDDIVLTAQDITELGVEEAPSDAGPSFEEIAVARRRRIDHG